MKVKPCWVVSTCVARSLLHRRCDVVYRYLLAIILVVITALLAPPLRNNILRPVWPKAWRTVGSIDLLLMEMTRGPTDVGNITRCPSLARPGVSKQDPRVVNVEAYEHIASSAVHLRQKNHVHFYPVLSPAEKSAALRLYLIFAEALTRAGVSFFLRAGSLLGTHRHHGFIPWDDDIDIAVNVTDWRKVLETLACVEGHFLLVQTNMHWVFFESSNRYPFIDLFFYTENNQYIYAVTQYTRRTFVLIKSEVFPLTEGQFEGIPVPIPGHTGVILRKQYDFDDCVSRSSDHRTGDSFDDIISVPCSSLKYMYKMYNLNS